MVECEIIGEPGLTRLAHFFVACSRDPAGVQIERKSTIVLVYSILYGGSSGEYVVTLILSSFNTC